MDEHKRKRLRAAILQHEAQEHGMSTETIVVGADPGNATTTVALPSGETVFFPSFIATIGVRPYSGHGNATRHHISMDGVNALVGIDALDIPGHDTLMADGYDEQDAYKRYLEPGSMYAILAGISALTPDAEHLNVALGTGAPLSIFEPHGETIRAHYLRRVEYAYNGRPRSVTFTDVKIYGEGMEAWRLLPEDKRRGNVVVHDLGGRTWNTILFKDGAMRAFRTFDMGVDRLLNAIPNISTDPAVRWAIQSEMRTNPKAHASLRVALSAVVTRALRVIERKVNLPAAHLHALAGGGALLLPAPIKALYGKPTHIIGDKTPETTNAIVYAKAVAGVM